MTWEDKGELVRLLNNGLYKEAVKFFGNEDDWDDQAVSMFVLGFDLSQCELLEPIRDRITEVQTNDFKTAIRLGVIQNYFDNK